MPFDTTDHSQEERDKSSNATEVTTVGESRSYVSPVSSQKETEREEKNASAVSTAQSQDKAPAQEAPKPPPLLEAVHVPMPSGGLQQLAVDLHPDDKDDAEKMSKHVAALLVLNRETLRNEYAHIVGTYVRIK